MNREERGRLGKIRVRRESATGYPGTQNSKVQGLNRGCTMTAFSAARARYPCPRHLCERQPHLCARISALRIVLLLFLRGAGGIARAALEKTPRTAPAGAPVAEIPSGFSSASAVVLAKDFLGASTLHSLDPARPQQQRRLLGGWCAARPPLGEHTLPPGGPVCVLSAQIIVNTGTSLSLRTLGSADGSGTPVDTLAVISGSGTTRLFGVDGGILTLKDLILDGGKQNTGARFMLELQPGEPLKDIHTKLCCHIWWHFLSQRRRHDPHRGGGRHTRYYSGQWQHREEVGST